MIRRYSILFEKKPITTADSQWQIIASYIYIISMHNECISKAYVISGIPLEYFKIVSALLK